MRIDRDNIAQVLAAVAQRYPATDTGRTSFSAEVATAEDAAAETDGWPKPDTVSVPQSGSAAGIDGHLAAVDEHLEQVLQTSVTAVADGAWLPVIDTLEYLRRRLSAVYLRSLAAADQVHAASLSPLGARSMQDYLRHGPRIEPSRAKADIAAARALHTSPGADGVLTRTAHVEAGPLRAMAPALAAGTITGAHVTTGVGVLEKIPHRLLTDTNTAAIGKFLVRQAPSHSPRRFAELAAYLVRTCDTATDDHYDPEAFLRRKLTMAVDITGMVFGSYQLDPAAGAEFRALLDPLSAPKPDQHGPDGALEGTDTRTADQRRADAIIELTRAAAAFLGTAAPTPPTPATPPDMTTATATASGSNTPTDMTTASATASGTNTPTDMTTASATASGTDAPTDMTAVTAERESTAATDQGQDTRQLPTPDTEKATAADSGPAWNAAAVTDGEPGFAARGAAVTDGVRGFAARGAAVTEEDLDAAAARGAMALFGLARAPGPGSADPSRDPAEAGTRAGRNGATICRPSAASRLRPGRHPARITITTTFNQLRTTGTAADPVAGFGRPDHPHGPRIPADTAPSYCDQLGTISPGTLSRLACDASFERAVLNTKGAVLELGHSIRLASPAQRRAVSIRDGGCIRPGCNRPPSWCDIHHVIWHSRGGPTDLDNLAVICPSDHSLIHTGILEATMIDGIPHVRYGPNARTRTLLNPYQGHAGNPWLRNTYFDDLKEAKNLAHTITTTPS